MKHLLRGLFIAVLFICCNFQLVLAQPMQELPVDKNVRIGKLDNGLTYYIRHNALPEKRVEFYIAQKVGSILEEPQQRGLAHFLEHMAFNGTKNFPGDETGLGIVPWCETKGIKFGTNLNAYTSVDQTVYNISNVPTENINVVDSCLLILHDWSSAIDLADKEIDKERGVIREEWRSRNSGMLRIMTDAQSTMYPDSKYSDCMPIGSIDVINNFPYQDIRDYYAKWYRPDLQGIVIVGDINVDEIEAKLKKVFADVKAPVNPAERIYYPVADNQEPLIYIGTDKEVKNPSVNIFFKQDATPDSLKNTIAYYATSYMVSMAMNMLNNRLNELRQTANPPFTSAGAEYGEYFLAKTKEAFSISASSKIDGIDLATKTILEEAERARRFGFTATEYDRARANYLQAVESAYNEREKTKSGSYVNEYVNNFLDKEPIPGIENEYAIINQIAPNIPVAALNQMMQALVTDTNQVVAIFGPEKEGIQMPTKDAVLQTLKDVKAEKLTAYVDKVSDEPLMAEKPQGGKIISEKENPIFGTTELTLSNGVKVILKKTDFKADEIRMKGTSLGGSSLFPDSEIINIKSLDAISAGGLGNFSAVDLEKVLAGKKASVNYGIGDKTENVTGSCSPKDLETMLQLTYLTFTAPRRDDDAFASYKNRNKAALQNQELNPNVAFGDSIQAAIYMHHPRAIRMKSDMIDKIDYDKLMEMYKDRYKDASDFTFIFVGNIDIAKDKDLIAEYLGALPAINRKETFRDTKLEMRKGTYKNEFIKQQETPKSSVFVVYNGKCKYNQKNNILMSMTSQILDLVYTEKVREEEGGTYGVYVGGSLSKYPKETALLQIIFDTAPDKKDKLMKIIFAEAENLAKAGPSDANLKKVKEYMLKKHTEDLKENRFWLGSIDEYIFTGVDMIKDYENLVNSITAKEVQKFADDLMKQKNEVEVTMVSPEKK